MQHVIVGHRGDLIDRHAGVVSLAIERVVQDVLERHVIAWIVSDLAVVIDDHVGNISADVKVSEIVVFLVVAETALHVEIDVNVDINLVLVDVYVLVVALGFAV